MWGGNSSQVSEKPPYLFEKNGGISMSALVHSFVHQIFIKDPWCQAKHLIMPLQGKHSYLFIGLPFPGIYKFQGSFLECVSEYKRKRRW